MNIIPGVMFDYLLEAQEYINLLRKNRSIYQTLRLICPKCGSTETISNNASSTGTLSIDIFGLLNFNCSHCKESVEIPIKIDGGLNAKVRATD